MIDLEAIRARNEDRRIRNDKDITDFFDGRARPFGKLPCDLGTIRSAISDVSVLIAEVKTLTASLQVSDAAGRASDEVRALRAEVERHTCRCGHMLVDHSLTNGAIPECPVCDESSPDSTFNCLPDETGKWGPLQ